MGLFRFQFFLSLTARLTSVLEYNLFGRAGCRPGYSPHYLLIHASASQVYHSLWFIGYSNTSTLLSLGVLNTHHSYVNPAVGPVLFVYFLLCFHLPAQVCEWVNHRELSAHWPWLAVDEKGESGEKAPLLMHMLGVI